MLARLTLIVIFTLGQFPASSMAMAGGASHDGAVAQSHCAEHTGESTIHHCDHVTQCQCAQACGTGPITTGAPDVALLPQPAPERQAIPATLPANRRLPLRPPSL